MVLGGRTGDEKTSKAMSDDTMTRAETALYELKLVKLPRVDEYRPEVIVAMIRGFNYRK